MCNIFKVLAERIPEEMMNALMRRVEYFAVS